VRFKSHLLNLAHSSKHHRYLHAAMVCKGKSVLGQGVNSEGHHAEVNAIFAANGNTKNATLYTLMVKKRSRALGDGTPCAVCMGVIKQAKIRRVILYI
jgi:pyrimidine deaminase RibD-like protein